jgi:NAD-dependent deacetylase
MEESKMVSENVLREVIAQWKKAKSVMVLTGAGISTESGLPDFRSAQGLWTKAPASLFSIEMMDKDPKTFYDFYRDWIRNIRRTEPNKGHRGLAALMKAGFIKTLATQNIDGLHQKAGATGVLELHGTLETLSCMQCGASYDSEMVAAGPAEIWYCSKCNGRLRPDIVMFGEALPPDVWEKAAYDGQQADLFVVVGSSLTVAPANLLPEWSVSRGASLLIINRDPTPLDSGADWVIRDGAGDVIEEIGRRLGILQ